MNVPSSRLMRWEFRRLRGETMSLSLLALWVLLLVIAGGQGAAATWDRHAEIELARAADALAWQEKRSKLQEVIAGRATAETFTDPRSPTGAVLGASADRPVVQPPTPLGVLVVGNTETMPAVRKSGMLTKVHLPPDNLENPANRLAGRLDLLFVVGALLPLFALALGFDVLARERELGMWPVLASQPTPVIRILTARLAVQFLLLWMPLAVVAVASSLVARAPNAAVLPAVLESLSWLLLVALYLAFWQGLAAAINLRGRSATGNALALCGAWLAFAVLVPAVAQVVLRGAAPAPDPLQLILAQRDADITLHRRIDDVRAEYYARNGYQPPTVALNEYDAFFVGNIVPRAFMTDAKLAPVLREMRVRREARARLTERMAWLSPTLAFRLTTEQLAGVTPLQRSRLSDAAHDFQRDWRAHFGAKLASMTPLSMADYDSMPAPAPVIFPLAERLRPAVPALAGLLLALAIALYLTVRSHDHD